MKKFVAVLAAVLLILGLAGCGQEQIPVDTDWTVFQKNYIPPTPGTSGTWAYSFAGDGGFVYIEGAAGSPAKYEFLLTREEAGEIRTKTVDVTESEYVQYEAGDTYTVRTWVWVDKE